MIAASPPVSGPDADRVRFPRARDWWLLAAGLCALFVFCLGSRGLNEPDEGRYANIAMAMTRPGGDWWEPRESGFAHYDKPPLVYWATALAFRAFGLNEWAARLPSLAGAGLALAGLGWAAARWYGRRLAWWSVLACGTSVQFWALGRVLSPDMLMTGWCTLAIAAWAECRHRGGAWRWWMVSLAGWTLAWWTKATPSLVPLAGLLVGTLAAGDHAGCRALRPWLLVPAVVALGSPWYLSMLTRYPELRRFFFGRELVDRMVGHVDGRHGSVAYYLPVSLAAWLPWWPVAAWNVWRRRPRAGALAGWRQRIGIEGWIVLTGVALFSLANSKLPTYTLALAPWAALLIVRGLPLGDGDGLPVFPLAVAGAFAGVAAVGATVLPPRYEAALGPNSSLRPVCRYLLAHGARVVDTDHYWPGMEFYLDGVAVHHVLHVSDSQQERASDPGLVPGRFIDPEDWLDRPGRPGLSPPATGERWLVRFRRNNDSPFDPVLSPGRREKVATVGQFDLFHVTLGPPPAASPSP